MAEGILAANGTVTVTLDGRVAQVVVTAVGGELWVTTDGSNPDYPKASTVRVIPARSPQAIPVSSLNEPTVVKLRSPKGADYTVVAGTQTDADSAPGMGTGASGASAAAEVAFTPAGTIAATDVQAALEELGTEKVATSVLAASGKGFVDHGAAAGTARPAGYASIEWYGSVEPTNAVNGDTWVDTSA